MVAVPISSISQGPVVVSGGLENLRSADIRLLQEAARLGNVHVRLWSDRLVAATTGREPQFTESERRFFLANIRYVESVSVIASLEAALRPLRGERPGTIVTPSHAASGLVRMACAKIGVECVQPGADQLRGFPISSDENHSSSGPQRVLVTGCFDWLHSGHVEFFREAAALGELYVVVGSDRNVRLLKGDRHPLRGQEERCYMVQAVRPVHRALVSTGSGWMDAEPEVAFLEPHLYVVNEDGDQVQKRDFCRAHGIEYVVLRRRPHRGLPRRTSTDMRGF